MKPSKFFLVCLISVLTASLSSETIVDYVPDRPEPRPLQPFTANYAYKTAERVDFTIDGFALTAESGSLKHDIEISLTRLPYKEGTSLPSNIENVTSMGDGIRLLPNGEHFEEDKPAHITLAYEPTRIPMGYRAEEIYTFYNDGVSWYRLERVAIDTSAHTVTSLTTHFTDFANAVIKVPEMPESKAFVPTTMTDLPDVDPLQGIPMIQVPVPNNRGTAELTYPIELPQGRRGMQPNIDLHYSSAGGNGILGVGWDLPLPAVTIDTRWGVPRYDPFFETEQYLVNGAPVVLKDTNNLSAYLPHQDNHLLNRRYGKVHFYARDTKNQDRIIRLGNNPTDYWWMVTDRNGVTTFYGGKFNPADISKPIVIDENSVVRTDSNCIAYWAATASIDVYGNYVLYTNNKTDNKIYINQIDYTGNAYQHVEPSYMVRFLYKWRDNVSSNGRLGLLQKDSYLLCNISVHYHYVYENKEYTDNLAMYVMKYSEPQESNLYKNRLEKIAMLDSVHDVIMLEPCNYSHVYSGSGFKRTSYSEEIVRKALEISMEDYYHAKEAQLYPYGQYSIPGSETRFEYEDAPTSTNIFGATSSIQNSNGASLSSSYNNGWSLGGTATLGIGFDVVTTTLSGGGNYDYSRSTGGCTSMLLDLNGDGLMDIVYAQNGVVWYRKQYKQGDTYAFATAVQVPGLTRLSREVSETHTWGAQVSFGANLSYNKPKTATYTDTYFSDVNGDGLPDLIDGDYILINQLVGVDQVPTFGEFTGVENQRIAVNNSRCGEIILDGEVDENIECEKQEVWINAFKLTDLVDAPVTYAWGTEELKDHPDAYPLMVYSDSAGAATIPETHINFVSDPFAADSSHVLSLPADYNADYIYRIEGNNVNVYRVDNICDTITEKNGGDYDIEMVKVWVAPEYGVVTLTDTLYLQEDTSQSRLRSLKADGIISSIQHCNNISTPSDSMHLHATHNYIIKRDTIEVDSDSIHTWSHSFFVYKGDVVLFRLRSRDNSLFDKTVWNHKFNYYSQQIIYDSQKDFVCSGDGHFQAVDTGRVVLTFNGSRTDSTPFKLQVRKANNIASTILKDSVITYPGILNITPLDFPVSANDSIYISLSPLSGSSDPRWGDIHIHPKLQYIADFPISDTTSATVHDTVVYYPDVKINCSSKYAPTSPYCKLFGPLHKGWGQFAYHNIANKDTIILDSLVNTQQYAATHTTMNPSYSFTFDPSGNWDSQINTILSTAGAYNPVSDSSYWVPMRADSRSEQWIAYGNLGCIGRSIHSNAREITIKEDVVDIVEYDSSLPFRSGETRKNNFVRKQAISTQESVSFGAPIIFNASASEGSYEAVVDYMDMNGDGFPDFVGKGGIQYSMPWGGIGKLEGASSFSPFRSENTAAGMSFSACPSDLEKIAGNNIRDGKFHLSASAGISGGTGSSSTRITYMDINADGLPDKVNAGNHSVQYNLGYKFSEPYYFQHAINEGTNESGSLSGSLSFSLGQVSISGGVGLSGSEEKTRVQMIDVNGDGLLDIVSIGSNDSVRVAYNTGTGINGVTFTSMNTLPNISSISNSITTNQSSTLGATGGFTFLGIVKFNVGIQSSPSTESTTEAQVMMTDMNGDGVTDYVWIENDQLKVRYNTAAKANLLKTVINPTGQKIELNYQLSDPTSAHRRQWELRQIVDSLPAHPMSNPKRSLTEIEYTNPYYDNFEKTDYGYEYVRTEENGLKVKEERYFNQTYLQNGELREDFIKDHAGHKYIRRIHDVKYLDVAHVESNGDSICNDANARMSQDGYWTEYYEGSSTPQITTHYNIIYDERHNIVEYWDNGDTATTSDDWRQLITYVPTTVNNQTSLPRLENVYDHGGHLLRRSSMVYNAFGLPAYINRIDTVLNMTATTYLEYDPLGNAAAIISPENANGERYWSKYDYDTETYSHITAIDNPFRSRTYNYWDNSWGLLARTIDPAGNTIRYYHDYKGRLQRVWAPMEFIHSKPYTVRYTYNLVNHNFKATVHYDYTHVYKDMYDSLFVQKEIALYDQVGRIMQKKHYSEINNSHGWIVDQNENWDVFGRVIRKGVPIRQQLQPDQYEPLSNAPIYVTYSYDALDRPLGQTNADGTTRDYTYYTGFDWQNIKRFGVRLEDENHTFTYTLKSPQDWLIQQVAGDGSNTLYTYSPIGELLQTIDADYYSTLYLYDMFGHSIRLEHPDAGTTRLSYDRAGNIIRKQTEKLHVLNDSIRYSYKFNRLTDISYPIHFGDSVHYDYDIAGRVSRRRDGAGSEMFTYDGLGNVSQSTRRIIIPTDSVAYIFRTRYEYDSFGRMRKLTYPDGEEVRYNYTSGGLLKSVIGTKQGVQHPYLSDRYYADLGNIIYQLYGNGVETTYNYNYQRQWLTNIYTRLLDNTYLQNLSYSYDNFGNIISVNQTAAQLTSPIFGGPYTNTYNYDNQYRLIHSESPINSSFPYSFNATYSPAGRIGYKYTDPNTWSSPVTLIFGYGDHHYNHQPRTAIGLGDGTTSFFWDVNGNLAQILNCSNGWSRRLHEWDEENRLRFVLGENTSAYYCYDANGERVYKLLGGNSFHQNINNTVSADVRIDDAVLYPNPYIVVTPQGYTKHYYAGAERLATAIGQGGLDTMIHPIDSLTQQDKKEYHKPFEEYYSRPYPFRYHHTIGDVITTETIDGRQINYLQYQCSPLELDRMNVVLSSRNIVLLPMTYYSQNRGIENKIYFYHGDHLGSAHWITDSSSVPIQYIHYAPYGELIVNQKPYTYDERYKFTGKERDSETGYDYFGARYYWSTLGIFTQSDPLAGKYPWITSYAYCANNPVKYIDPDGREKHIFLSKNDSYAAKNFRDDNGIYIFGHGSPGPHGFIADDRGSKREALSVTKLANQILNEGDQYKIDAAEGNTSMIFLYACHTGEGDNNVAQQLSSVLNDHETLVIGPIGILESSNDPRYPQNGSYDGVKNSNTKKEGAWGVYKNGQLQTTIRGNRTPTKATVKCKMFFDNLLKSIKNFFKNENE